MVLPKTAKPIDNSINHWVDIDGSIYSKNKYGEIYKKAQSTVHGYKYCGIRYKDKTISKRVHKLVAKAFIPNENNYTIVGHKNNIKGDNRVENLYWTTSSENTRKAYADGLASNDKGYEDSQSKPVIMFSTYTNEVIAKFGSITEASKSTGIQKTTISRQARYHRPVRKEFYFRFIDDESVNKPNLIGMFDYDTDKLMDTYINISDASNKTGISDSTINYQVNQSSKPKHKFNNFYFRYINSNKCEQTIENK